MSKIHMEKCDENTHGKVSVYKWNTIEKVTHYKENTNKKVSLYKENTHKKVSVYKVNTREKNTHEKVLVWTYRFWYKISLSEDLWYIYMFNKNSSNITMKIL